MQDKLNGKSIRAMCTDIDGTLLDSRRELSHNTIEIIRKLSALMPVSTCVFAYAKCYAPFAK